MEEDVKEDEEMIAVSGPVRGGGGHWGTGKTLEEAMENASAGFGSHQCPVMTVVKGKNIGIDSAFGTIYGDDLQKLGDINLFKLLPLSQLSQLMQEMLCCLNNNGLLASMGAAAEETGYLEVDRQMLAWAKEGQDHLQNLSEILEHLEWADDPDDDPEYEHKVVLHRRLLRELWHLTPAAAEDMVPLKEPIHEE